VDELSTIDEIVRVQAPRPSSLTIATAWSLRSRIHFWSYGFRKTRTLSPQRGYLADFADSELTW
jgi:hypothetical protein